MAKPFGFLLKHNYSPHRYYLFLSLHWILEMKVRCFIRNKIPLPNMHACVSYKVRSFHRDGRAPDETWRRSKRHSFSSGGLWLLNQGNNEIAGVSVNPEMRTGNSNWNKMTHIFLWICCFIYLPFRTASYSCRMTAQLFSCFAYVKVAMQVCGNAETALYWYLYWTCRT